MFLPAPKQPWGKWLWKRQPYEDNYVDEGLFLRGLRTNSLFYFSAQNLLFLVNVVEYEYWDVVVDSTVITGQVMTVALYNTLFLHLYKELIPPVYLGSLCVFFLVLGFAVRIALEWGQWSRKFSLSPYFLSHPFLLRSQNFLPYQILISCIFRGLDS